MERLSTPLPNFAEAMLLSIVDLQRFDVIWDSCGILDELMMEFGGYLDDNVPT